jgi:hypothetical protein
MLPRYTDQQRVCYECTESIDWLIASSVALYVAGGGTTPNTIASAASAAISPYGRVLDMMFMESGSSEDGDDDTPTL